MTTNRIQAENALPGTGAWRIVSRCPTPGVPTTANADPSAAWGATPAMPAGQGYAWGYAGATSVPLGGTLDLHIAATDPTYRLQVFRMGWYGGAYGRLMTLADGTTITPALTGTPQSVPTQDWTNGGVIDCTWPVSYRLRIPASWVSGVYLAKIRSVPAAASTLTADANPGAGWDGHTLHVGSTTPYSIGQFVVVGSFANGETANVTAINSGAGTISVSLPTNAALVGTYLTGSPVLPLPMESWIPFVVRDDAHPLPLVYKASSLDWQAYNAWGGANAYGRYDNPEALTNPGSDYTVWSHAFRSHVISANRPYWQQSGTFVSFPGWNTHDLELPVIAAIEQLGLPVTYCDDLDIHSGGLPYLQQFALLISGQHAEYLTASIRDSMDQFVRQGGRVLMCGANQFYKQNRMFPDSRGAANRWFRNDLDYGMLGNAVSPGAATVTWAGNGTSSWANTLPPGSMTVGQTVIAGSEQVTVTAVQTDGSGNVTGYSAVFTQSHTTSTTHQFECDPIQTSNPAAVAGIYSRPLPNRSETLSQGALYAFTTSPTYQILTVLGGDPSLAGTGLVPGSTAFELVGNEMDQAGVTNTSLGDVLIPGRLVPLSGGRVTGTSGTKTHGMSRFAPLGGGELVNAATFALTDGVNNYRQATETSNHAALADGIRQWFANLIHALCPGLAVGTYPTVTRPYAIGAGPSPSASPPNTADYSTSMTTQSTAASVACSANAASAGGSTVLGGISGTISDQWSLAAGGGTITFTITPSTDTTPVILTEYSTDGGTTWTAGTSFAITQAGTYAILVRIVNAAGGLRRTDRYNVIVTA